MGLCRASVPVQWKGTAWNLVCRSTAGSSATMQLTGAQKMPTCPQKGYSLAGCSYAPVKEVEHWCAWGTLASQNPWRDQAQPDTFFICCPSESIIIQLCLRPSPFLTCRRPAHSGVLEKLPLASLFLENHAATFMVALHRANKTLGRHQLLWCPQPQDMVQRMGTTTRMYSSKFLARNIAILYDGWSLLSTVPQHWVRIQQTGKQRNKIHPSP